MYRTCSKATKAKIANIKLPAHSPGWLRGAVSNARSNNPMSEKQELRMIAALGIAPPKRQTRRFYRPCLPVELGEQVKLNGVDVEAVLREYLQDYNHE